VLWFEESVKVKGTCKNPVMTLPQPRKETTELFLIEQRTALYKGPTQIRAVTKEGHQRADCMA